ncbi:gamma-glutamylcyclotransferase [Acuticoccus sp. M5D2P5]|uniref:gamma-glutamylcyclotransferase n=1 Tax=Acuticoccus kalidii TaxID=2910977 RepID=UPI001F4773FC|nr:gamma-glutamylcyclotransferase [Acuticoccus kalidii]MCF3934255.1 gamma-glutamylcyclotransferase [Acuticoccus kalidii]
MMLTPELVALSLREEPDLGPEPGWTLLTDDELDALARHFDAECGSDPLWIFAYGSLIWKPGFAHVAEERATAFGWHRSFCLKLRRFRGSPEQPGLMMALERGGRCDGLIYRLPDEGRLEEIRAALVREVRFHQNRDMVRWITVRTETGNRRVLTFWAGPKGERVTDKLSHEEIAYILARACGSVGSCAEYLYNTVAHLEEYGIRDRNLWALQHLVAEELKAIHTA